MFRVVDPADCHMQLFTKEEAQAALDSIKLVDEYNIPLLDVTHGASSGKDLTPEGACYEASKNNSYDPQYEDVPEFEELESVPHPHCEGMMARTMARLVAYLKKHGGFQLVTTQSLGNCLYSSVLRGTNCKAEFVSMHLRRLLITMISAYPDFFFPYLQHAIATTFGQDRPSPEEIDRREREGLITPEQSHDYRLPGPFSFAQYCEHILKDGAPGEMIFHLTLVSMLWQISITVLNADTLGEIRIRHNRPMRNVDLLIIFINGDHYMGAGKIPQRHVFLPQG